MPQTNINRFKKRLKVVGILIVSACTAILLVGLNIRSIINYFLNDSAIQVSAFTIESISFDRLEISNLAVVSNLGYAADIDKLYVQASSVNGQKRYQLNAGTLSLSLRPSNTATKNIKAPSEKPISDYLPSNIFSIVPNASLIVAQVKFDNNLISAYKLEQVKNLTIEKNASKLAVWADVAPAKTPESESYRVQAKVDTQNNLRLAVYSKTNKTALASIDLAAVAKDSSVQINAQLTADANIKLANSLVEARNYSLKSNAKVDLTVDDRSINNTLAKPNLTLTLAGNLSLHSVGKASSVSLRVTPKLELAVNGSSWQAGLTTSNNEPALISGSIGTNSDKQAISLNTEPNLIFEGTLPKGLLTNSVSSADSFSFYLKHPTQIRSSYSFGTYKDTAISNISAFKGAGHLASGIAQASLNANIGASLNALSEYLKHHSKTFSGVEIKDTKIAADFAFDFKSPNSYLTVTQESKVKASSISRGNNKVNRFELLLPEQKVVFTSLLPLPEEIQFLVKARQIDLGGHLINPLTDDNVFTFDGQGINLISSLSSKPLGNTDSKKGFSLPPYVFNVSTDIESNEIGANTTSSIKSILDLASRKIEFNWQNQCGENILSGQLLNVSLLQANANHSFNSLHTFTQLLDIPPETMDITAGQLLVDINWQLQEELPPKSLKISLNSANLTGRLGSFNDVQLVLSSNDALFAYNLNGSVASANLGMDVSNIGFDSQVDLSGNMPKIHLNKVKASVFSGLVKVEHQLWFPPGNTEIIVNLEGIDLDSVIRSQNISALRTTGVLSGSQPVRITEGGQFELLEGNLNSTKSGVIQYESSLAANANLNPELKYTMDILKNFEYEQLTTSTSLRDGSLFFNSTILGRNPEVEQGKKIRLNLNTEMEVESSIKMMRIQSGLESQISKFYEHENSYSLKRYCSMDSLH